MSHPKVTTYSRTRHQTTLVHLSGLGTVKTNYRDPLLSATYRDWQKPRHRDADGN